LRLGSPQKLVTAIRLASSPQAWVGTHPKLTPPGAFLLQRTSPLLAQSGRYATEFQCPLLGVKRTSTATTKLTNRCGCPLFAPLNFVEKLREKIAQLDGRSRFAIGIKRHRAIAFAINFPCGDRRRWLAFRAAIPSRSPLATRTALALFALGSALGRLLGRRCSRFASKHS